MTKVPQGLKMVLLFAVVQASGVHLLKPSAPLEKLDMRWRTQLSGCLFRPHDAGKNKHLDEKICQGGLLPWQIAIMSPI